MRPSAPTATDSGFFSPVTRGLGSSAAPRGVAKASDSNSGNRCLIGGVLCWRTAVGQSATGEMIADGFAAAEWRTDFLWVCMDIGWKWKRIIAESQGYRQQTWKKVEPFAPWRT